ncbi:hypothetical protein EAI52_21015 [Escherichia coli]|nr:hypothetical protein EAI52_21015 [Escherichia coli]
MIDPQRKGISDDILFQRGLKGEGLALLKSVDINRSSPFSDDILFQRGLKGEGLALLKSVDINRSSP